MYTRATQKGNVLYEIEVRSQKRMNRGYDRKMKIYFARHGRTNYNDLGLCNADPNVDVHLTTQGLKQAKDLADKLKDISIERIYISELKRTRQTADIVNEFHRVTIEVDPLLNDHRSGFEGQSAELLMKALDESENRWTARFNDGESIDDMKQRVGQFVSKLKDEPYASVLVVTSQWVIYAAVAIIRDISNEEAWKLGIQQATCLELEV
jgi:broad specificity phosphatase PhoE